MNQIRKWSLFICILASVNMGIEGLFEVDLLQKLFVNLPLILQIFKISCLFSGTVLILMLFER